MIPMKFIRICLPWFIASCLLRMDSAFSQDDSSRLEPVVEIVADVESPNSIEESTVEQDARKPIWAAWQRELRVAARGELVFARMACGLNAELTDLLWQALQPRLENMNDLVLFASGDMVVVEAVLEEVDVLGVEVQLAEQVDEQVLEGDEARQMEIELDQLQNDEAFIDVTTATAYTGDGIALKANPYTRLRQEFREALETMVSPEQLERYDQECSARDQFRRNAALNVIMGNLLKSLRLDPTQEKKIRQALANSMKQLDDLDISSYLYDVDMIPEIADAKIKKFFTVRQRAKWNDLANYDFPIQMPYIDPETEEDD